MNNHLINPRKVDWGTHQPVKSAKGKTSHTNIYDPYGHGTHQAKWVKQVAQEYARKQFIYRPQEGNSDF